MIKLASNINHLSSTPYPNSSCWRYSYLQTSYFQSNTSLAFAASPHRPNDHLEKSAHHVGIQYIAADQQKPKLCYLINTPNAEDSEERELTEASISDSAKTLQLNKPNGSSRQNQTKRQKEWIYLCHYIAISGLNPLHIISGQDDGQEPDFTLIFYQHSRLYYVGVELTTLPRLRDQMGEEALIAKRWYWQGLQVMAKQRQKMPSYQRFKLPVQTIYMPTDDYNQRLAQLPHSIVSQTDIDAVMQKKAHKVAGYQTRRPLDELWLLVHTDKYQPESILTSAKKPLALFHDSGFDQVQVTRYPSHKIINVHKIINLLKKSANLSSQ